MLLKSLDGSEFALELVNYQFPDKWFDEWDSNWLIISIRVKTPLGSWNTIDACLVTWEVAELSRWLKKLASEPIAKSSLGFTEPNLRFELVDKTNTCITIRVYFEQEARPPWSSSKKTFEFEEAADWVDLKVTPGELEEAAIDLQSQLHRFPFRKGEKPGL
jgi:hypothetical protein